GGFHRRNPAQCPAGAEWIQRTDAEGRRGVARTPGRGARGIWQPIDLRTGRFSAALSSLDAWRGGKGPGGGAGKGAIQLQQRAGCMESDGRSQTIGNAQRSGADQRTGGGAVPRAPGKHHQLLDGGNRGYTRSSIPRFYL